MLLDQSKELFLIGFLLVAEERSFEVKEAIDLELEDLALVLTGPQLL